MQVTVEECGLFLHPDTGYFGVSPDGLVQDPHTYRPDDLVQDPHTYPQDGLLEIKCPYKHRNSTVCKLARTEISAV